MVAVEANKPYTSKFPGWFVPDARMQEIVEQLDIKDMLPPAPPNPNFPKPKVN